MSGYRGFASKAEYEAYYSDINNYAHELPMMEAYTRECEEERNIMSVVDTKACNLTEAEIVHLIAYHGYSLTETAAQINGDRLERINYLHRRLKAFQEPDAKPVAEAKPEAGTAPVTTSVQAAPNGWGQ